MFVNYQHLDTNCFHILNSIKTTPSTGVSVPPYPDKLEQPIKQKPILENPRDTHRRFSRVDVKPNHNQKCTPTVRRDAKVNEEVHGKCLTKWARYGGCVPAMLEALETVRDLDEAFRPWEESLSNKERSIILKEQSGWERALEIFEWFKRKGCYEVNVIHYNIMLRTLGKARRWNEVERLWDEMGRRRIKPINSTYGTLIDVYSKGGLREKALNWLALMNEQGMEPDEVTMGIVVQMYKKVGQFKDAENFFKKWSSGKCGMQDKPNTRKLSASYAVNGHDQEHLCLSSYTYNTLIDTYGKAGRLKDASETFARMLKEGVVPNTVTFNTMIHTYGNHGQIEEVASLMQKMEQRGCTPDTRTYNILIALHTKHGSIDLAAGYFKKMKASSLKPDLVSYRTLLYAYSIRHMVVDAERLMSEMDENGIDMDEFTQSALTRMYIEAGMLEKALLWFKRFHIAGNMSRDGYSANIDAFGERGYVSEAEEVFKCCKERENLSVLEFNVMIKAYGINQRYEEACRLFDSMEKNGVVPDKCSYNSLIQMLASGDLPQIAKSYVGKMQEAGLVSDCIPYCAVISSFAKVGQLEMAVGVFEEMIGFDVQPDVVVYGILINAFADIGSVDKALRYVNAMRDAGLPMNAVIYNSLIKLYKKVGCLKEAEEAYRMLQSLDASPDTYSSNIMIDLYSERSMVEQAEHMFENLKKTGDANEFSYAMMLCMYKRVGRFEDAIQIAQKMREQGLLTDLLSYNHVLGLYASDGRFKEAAEIFKEMMESAIQPDDSTFGSLVVALVKRGVSKQAVDKLAVMWKKGDQVRALAYMSTYYSEVGMDDSDDIDEE
ncbi:hypothetical protein RJ640_011529 [Escallonia rubra]|uniref:Pentatricopeptide repeat-containing protein n=1 Tax=Escallonia rubra TaxID=112253 RepID=A0AA88RB89_9ASTE|nr:hypothetical protein RJ640_011529 [Escallonia rubra]